MPGVAPLDNYLYAKGCPVNIYDPSGHEGLLEMMAVFCVIGVLDAMAIPSAPTVTLRRTTIIIVDTEDIGGPLRARGSQMLGSATATKGHNADILIFDARSNYLKREKRGSGFVVCAQGRPEKSITPRLSVPQTTKPDPICSVLYVPSRG